MAVPEEIYPSDAALNLLSGTTDSDSNEIHIAIGSEYYTDAYKKDHMNILARAQSNSLRVCKVGDLTCGVYPGKYLNGDSLVTYAGAATQVLTDDATNYLYLTAAGTLTVNTTGFPVPSVTSHIRLASIAVGSASAAAVSGEYNQVDIVDYRGTSLLSISGAAAGDLNNLDWQASLADELDFTAAEPTGQSVGDRYLNTGSGASSETTQTVAANDIEEWNGTDWTEITPSEGYCALVEDRDMLIAFNGSTWVDIGTFALLNEAQLFFAATDITGAQAETLTDTSNADALHVHTLDSGISDVTATAAQLNEAGTFFAATDITGAEAETLTDDSNADLLHKHNIDEITDGTTFKKVSTDEKLALAGTSGTAPSTTNKFVDETDLQTFSLSRGAYHCKKIPLATVFRAPTDGTNLNDWVSDGYATESADIVNYKGSLAATRANLKLTSSAHDLIQSANILTGGAEDLSNTLFRIRFRPNDTTHAISEHGIRFYLRSGATWDNFAYRQIWDMEAVYPQDIYQPDGWYEYWGSIEDGWFVETGTLNTAAVDLVRFRQDLSESDSTSNTTYDGPYFFTIPTRTPKLAITFDDGKVSQYDAACYMAAKGLRGTFYVVSDWVGSSASYLTETQLRNMQNMGHLIGNHSDEHTYGLTGTARIASIYNCARWMLEHGFGEGAYHYSSPGGTSRMLVEDSESIAGSHCNTIRQTNSMSQFMYPGSNILSTQAFEDASASSTLLTNLKTWKMDGCVGFHEGDVAGIETFFDNCATDQDAGNVEIVTVAEL